MGKAAILAAVTAAVVAGELVGWSMGLEPLVAAKTVMLGALVYFNCLKLSDSPKKHDKPLLHAPWLHSLGPSKSGSGERQQPVSDHEGKLAA